MIIDRRNLPASKVPERARNMVRIVGAGCDTKDALHRFFGIEPHQRIQISRVNTALQFARERGWIRYNKPRWVVTEKGRQLEAA